MSLLKITCPKNGREIKDRLDRFCPYFDRCVIIWAFYGPKVVKRRHSARLTFGTLLQLLFIGHRQI